jgi:hypothetical protein
MPISFCGFENHDQIDYAQYWYHEDPIPKLFVGPQKYGPHVIHSIYMTTLSISSYVLAIVFARKTLSELKRQSSSFSTKTKSLHEQFARLVGLLVFVYFLGLYSPRPCAHSISFVIYTLFIDIFSNGSYSGGSLDLFRVFELQIREAGRCRDDASKFRVISNLI